MPDDGTIDQRAAFVALFEAHFDALLAYARRRCSQPSDAEDVVAETFTTAWRRFDRLPARPDEHRLWLFGVARRVLANQRRATGRRMRLLERLRWRPASSTVGTQLDAGAALETLSERDQEVLRLIAWEDLTHAEAAVVLGISTNAVAIRLHRARAKLRGALKGSPPNRTWPRWRGNVPHEHREEAS